MERCDCPGTDGFISCPVLVSSPGICNADCHHLLTSSTFCVTEEFQWWKMRKESTVAEATCQFGLCQGTEARELPSQLHSCDSNQKALEGGTRLVPLLPF